MQSNLQQRLTQLVGQRQWPQLHTLLGTLTNSEFRKVEQIVRQGILPTLPNEHFWEALAQLIAFRPQAFLTGITAISHLAADGTLMFQTPAATDLSCQLSDIQRQKLADMAIPLLRTEGQISALFDWLSITDERQQAALLIRSTTPLAYFMLFRTLRHIPDHRDFALRCCRHILRKGDDLSYNMAAILRAYFGLHEIQNQLSLRIEPYELSYLDTSFDTFRYAVEGKKPKVF